MKIIEKGVDVDIDLIDNWKNNARAIQKEDFDRLKSQIAELGVYKPMICYKEGDKYIVLGGNMRLRAIRELGHKTGWLTVIEPENEAEKLRINISDNDRVGFYQAEALAEAMYPFKDDYIWDDYKIEFDIPDENISMFNKHYFEDGYDISTMEDDEDKEGEPEFGQITFILHKKQMEKVRKALDLSITKDNLKSIYTKNKNSNALEFICTQYLSNNG